MQREDATEKLAGILVARRLRQEIWRQKNGARAPEAKPFRQKSWRT
jgi:hypothetical protein